MRQKHIKKSMLTGCSAALVLGLSLPILASCGGNHGDESHHDMAKDSAEHAGSHAGETAKVSENVATKAQGHSHEHDYDSGMAAAGHHENNMMADTVMATVVHVDVENRQLALDHEALPTIGMEAMAMAFNLDDGVSIAGIEKDDKVKITVAMKPGKGLVITEVNVVK